MAELNGVSLEKVEEMVTALGNSMLVYGVGPLDVSASGKIMEDLKAFKFYQDKAQAQAAYDALVDKGASTGAVELCFYLNEGGYLEAKHIKNLEAVND